MSSYNEKFIAGFLRAAIFAENDQSNEQGGEPIDRNYAVDDFDPQDRVLLEKECLDFIAANKQDLEGIDPEQAGHDFWLTRNGHGTGFWDRGLGEQGERLTKACDQLDEITLSVDNGVIHAD